MARRRRPPTLQQAAQADIERQRQAELDELGDLYPGGHSDDLRPWDVKAARHLKRGTRLLLAGASIVAAAATFAGGVVKAWRTWRAGTVQAPELPATGIASTAVDRVDKPAQLARGPKDK